MLMYLREGRKEESEHATLILAVDREAGNQVEEYPSSSHPVCICRANHECSTRTLSCCVPYLYRTYRLHTRD